MRFPVPEDPYLDNGRIELLLHLGGKPDPAFLLDCVQTFEEEFSQRQIRLSQAAASGDTDAVRQQIHFLIGSGANLGLALLARLCRHYEEALLNNKPLPLTQVAESVDTTVALSLNKLKARLKNTAS